MPGSRVGGIAQLGERLHGMQEVSGSIPLTSTIVWFCTAGGCLELKFAAHRWQEKLRVVSPHRLEA